MRTTSRARFRALFEPSERFDALVTLDYADQDRMGLGISICPPGSASAVCAGVRWDPYVGVPPQFQQDFQRSTHRGIYADLNWHLGWATLTYVPAMRNVDYSEAIEFTPLFAWDPNSIDNDFMTHELRLASAPESPFTWVAGLYYSDEDSQTYTVTKGFGAVQLVADQFAYEAKSRAAFAQVTWPLLDRYRLTLGARYTKDEKTDSTRFSSPLLVSDLLSRAEQEIDKLTWKAGLEADLTESSLLYVSASTGFKAGGVNTIPGGFDLPEQYEPEEITAVQVGTKNRFLDDRLQVNAELFHYDYEQFQVLDFGPLVPPSAELPGGAAYLAYTLNSQTAEFFGGEIEASMRVTAVDRIDVNLSWLDAHYRTFIVPTFFGGTLDRSGFPVRNAPKFAGSFSYEHVFALSSGASVSANVQSRYTSAYWAEDQLLPGSRQDAYTTTGINLTYTSARGNWRVTAWGRNLENEGALTSFSSAGFFNGGVGELGFPYPPRAFGARFSIDFR